MAYYASNPVATVVTALLQVLSVAGLLMFARSTASSGTRAVLAWTAVTAMVVSSVLIGVLAMVAAGATESTVVLLRQLGFYAGGVVHVVALGSFVVASVAVLHRDGVIRRGLRIFRYVAGALALLSVLALLHGVMSSVLIPRAGRGPSCPSTWWFRGFRGEPAVSTPSDGVTPPARISVSVHGRLKGLREAGWCRLNVRMHRSIRR